MTTVSNIGLQLLLTGNLQSEQSTLGILNEELASNKKFDNLTNYVPTDALNLINYQNVITQKRSYLGSIQTVQSRLTAYDATMTDMENIAGQAGALASSSQNFNATTATQIQAQVKNYLLQVSNDLNQQIGGRYIYAGTRYTTSPVTSDLNILTGAPQTIITNSQTLPDYDTEKIANGSALPTPTSKVTFDANLPSDATVNFTSTPSTVQIFDSTGATHNLTYTWTKTGTNDWTLDATAAGSAPAFHAKIDFVFNDGTNGPAGTVASMSQDPSSPSNITVDTPTTAGNPANIDMSANFGSGAQGITLNFGTYDQAGGLSQNFDSNSPVSVTNPTFTQNGLPAGSINDPNAYTADSAVVDNSLTVTYGISSDDPAFQRLINGLRFMNAAVVAGQGGDTVTYQSDMQQAAAMLSTSLTNIQTLHTGVASNQNTLTSETTAQNTDITNLQNQIGSIQDVDTTQIATEITVLTAQLQASYSATGNLEQLSLVKYL
jgi:flagellin-like hook-associated protein FlgL